MIRTRGHRGRANKTIKLISKVVPVDFAIAGSYSRSVRHGNEANDPFTDKSDLDIVVEEKDILKVTNALEALIEKDHKVHITKGDGSDNAERAVEYTVKIDDLTPLHIIGSYTPEKVEGITVIGNIKYLQTVSGYV